MIKNKCFITYSLVFILSIMLIIYACAFAINSQNQSVYADYEDIVNDRDAIVNFNQIVDPSRVSTGVTFSGDTYYLTGDSTRWYAVNSYTLISGHKYFCYENRPEGYSVECKFDGSNISFYGTSILTASSTGEYRFYFKGRDGLDYYNLPVNCYVIDLTQMFGANEPNYSQCLDIFVARFYPYNTGIPVSLNGLNAYADGVNSVLSGQSIHYSREYVANNMQPVRFDDITGNYSLDIENDVINLPRYRYNINDHVQITFASVITSGQNFKLTFWLCRDEYNDVTPLEIGYFLQGRFYPITSINATAPFDNLQYYELDLTAPVDMNSIVLNIPRTYELNDPDSQWYSVYMADIELTYILEDATALLRNAQDYGYNQAQSQYSAMLDSYNGSNGVGGSGYMQIYNEGLQVGANTQLEELGMHFYTFSDFLGALFDVPVHTIISLLDFNVFGFNMKNLVFSLITLSIVFAIIKLILVKTGD